jgi:hypothetical protein
MDRRPISPDGRARYRRSEDPFFNAILLRRIDRENMRLYDVGAYSPLYLAIYIVGDRFEAFP